jgi:hypothetical protein
LVIIVGAIITANPGASQQVPGEMADLPWRIGRQALNAADASNI